MKNILCVLMAFAFKVSTIAATDIVEAANPQQSIPDASCALTKFRIEYDQIKHIFTGNNLSSEDCKKARRIHAMMERSIDLYISSLPLHMSQYDYRKGFVDDKITIAHLLGLAYMCTVFRDYIIASDSSLVARNYIFLSMVHEIHNSNTLNQPSEAEKDALEELAANQETYNEFMVRYYALQAEVTELRDENTHLKNMLRQAQQDLHDYQSREALRTISATGAPRRPSIPQHARCNLENPRRSRLTSNPAYSASTPVQE